MRNVTHDETQPAPRAMVAPSVTADFVRAKSPSPAPLPAKSFMPAAAQAAPEFTPLPGEFLEHYEIIRKLGQGGMGVVLLARDTKLGRLVAIKLLQDRGHASLRLLAEARATASSPARLLAA